MKVYERVKQTNYGAHEPTSELLAAINVLTPCNK